MIPHAFRRTPAGTVGVEESYRELWWDVRPHHALGTLEIRMPDQPTSLDLTAAFVALLQALAAGVEPGGRADRGLYAQNRPSSSSALRRSSGARKRRAPCALCRPRAG